VTLDLAPIGDRTELTVRHRQPRTDHWAKFGPGATGVGWDLITLGLGQHLAGLEDPRPAFAENPDANAFIRGAADAWRAAHEKAGAPAEVAARVAKATADAFTGVASEEA